MASQLGAQLVVTLGPASMDQAGELWAAGATSFRLNASHMSADELQRAVAALRALQPEAPLVVDLQGAKMRLGRFAERAVRRGEPIAFAPAARAEAVPLPHPELFHQARRGETLSLDDDRLRLEVTSASPERLEARALVDGWLRPRKGVNVVEHPVELQDLSPADQEIVAALADVADLSWALSFMADGREAGWLRRRLPRAPVTGKVERREALENLGEVAAATDGLWICRGDLGAQVGMAVLARFVAAFTPRALPGPVLMAGQVLEHLTQHAEPTRSEVCHLYDLATRGYAGIVLSDETAIGRDPVNAVRVASRLLRDLGA